MRVVIIAVGGDAPEVVNTQPTSLFCETILVELLLFIQYPLKTSFYPLRNNRRKHVLLTYPKPIHKLFVLPTEGRKEGTYATTTTLTKGKPIA